MTKKETAQHDLLTNILEAAQEIQEETKNLDHGCWGSIDTIRNRAGQLIEDILPLKKALDTLSGNAKRQVRREIDKKYSHTKKLKSHDKSGMVESMENIA